MGLKINHIQHIGIPVTDLKISEAFYQLFNSHQTLTFVAA